MHCQNSSYSAAFLLHMGIGQNLKALRDAAELTQEALAEAVGVQQSDISKWERDAVTPDLVSVLKLARGIQNFTESVRCRTRPDVRRHSE